MIPAKTFFIYLSIGTILFLVGFGVGIALNPIDNAMLTEKYSDCIEKHNDLVDILKEKRNCPIKQETINTTLLKW